MRFSDAHVGQWVVYRPHLNARYEDGEVTELVPSMTAVRVRFTGERISKLCYVSDLSAGHSTKE